MQEQGRPEGTPGGEARPLFGGGTTSGHATGGSSVGGGMGAMSAQDEQTWSMVSHLTVLTFLVSLPVLGALVVWLMYKDKSPRVRFHALQALWYQLAWVILIAAYSFLSLVLTIVVIGFFMFFLIPILGLIPVVHGCYAAYRVSQGEDYRYPFIADRISGNTGRVV